MLHILDYHSDGACLFLSIPDPDQVIDEHQIEDRRGEGGQQEEPDVEAGLEVEAPVEVAAEVGAHLGLHLVS